MKYNYDANLEAYVREDGLGKKIWVNSVESQRIMTLYNLGNTIPEIRNKIKFNSNKVRESTIDSFIKNVNNGNIVIPTDAPLPIAESLTIEERLQRLENDLEEFRVKYLADKKKETSVIGKVKSWIK